MTAFAKLLLAFGVLMALVSALLCGYQDLGTPEAMVNLLDLGLGVLMVSLGAAYLMYQKKKTAHREKDEEKQQNRKGG